MTSREDIVGPTNKWWGLLTPGGNLVIGKYLDGLDIDELMNLPVARRVIGPFFAADKLSAIVQAHVILEHESVVLYAEDLKRKD